MIKLMQGSEEINSNGGLSFVKRLLDGNARMNLKKAIKAEV